jgi:hypothetical protein
VANKPLYRHPFPSLAAAVLPTLERERQTPPRKATPRKAKTARRLATPKALTLTPAPSTQTRMP